MIEVIGEKGIVLVVSAPSGAGKTTICREVLKAFPDLRFSVSCTTRSPRAEEKEGEDYHFISKEEFKNRLNAGDFAEWEENYGNFYGTLKKNIENITEKGCDILLDVDTKGAKNIKEEYPDAVLVFVLPPSVDILKERLKGRGSESEDAFRLRIEKAMSEIKEHEWYDYIIFNDIAAHSIEILKSVYIAEKCRRERLENRINNFCKITGGI